MDRALTILIPKELPADSSDLYPLLESMVGRRVVEVFRYQDLTGLRKQRFEAWLWLRAAINGKSASVQDHRLALKNALPAIQTFYVAQSTEPPFETTIAESLDEYENVRGRFRLPGRNVQESRKFLQRLMEEYCFTDSPRRAYEYWCARIFRHTTLVEWQGSPAVLCVGDKSLSAGELANYVRVLIGDGTSMCLRCHRVFAGKRSNAEYCSDRCRWARQKSNQRKKALHKTASKP